MSYLKQYEYIKAIAECRSITIAAERLGIAQSALSRYVKNLEQNIGAQLLNRSSDPISLTQAGVCFLEIGTKMLALNQDLKSCLRNLKTSEFSTIRIGVGPSRGPCILPAVLTLYRKRDSRTNIEIYELTTAEITQRLLQNDLDIAISVFDSDLLHIEHVNLFKERILLCENSKKPCNCPILPGKGQLLRDVMNKIIESNDTYSKNYIEVQNAETAVALVKAGLGFTIAPSYFEEFSHGDELTFSELPDSIVLNDRDISLLYRKGRKLTKEELLFIECAQQALGL